MHLKSFLLGPSALSLCAGRDRYKSCATLGSRCEHSHRGAPTNAAYVVLNAVVCARSVSHGEAWDERIDEVASHFLGFSKGNLPTFSPQFARVTGGDIQVVP